jgi:D-alanine transaminase
LILYNDRILAKDDVHISPDDRGYYFGDGIYEVFRIYGGAFFEKEAHMARLMRSLDEIRISLPYPREQLEARLDDLLRANGLTDGTVYLQVTRGNAPRNHAFPAADCRPVLLAYCTQMTRPLASQQSGIAAVTAPDIRWLRCDIKSLNLLPNVLARQEAVEREAGETIFHRGETVTEGSSSNIMIVKDGILWTHPADNYILNGITRLVVLRLAAQLDIPVREETYTLSEMFAADEVIVTSTGVEIMPAVAVDGRPIGSGQPGPVTRKLQEAFEALIG